MSTHVEGDTFEAEITKCCHAINEATDDKLALDLWSQLRKLMVQREEVRKKQFIRDTMHE